MAEGGPFALVGRGGSGMSSRRLLPAGGDGSKQLCCAFRTGLILNSHQPRVPSFLMHTNTSAVSDLPATQNCPGRENYSPL